MSLDADALEFRSDEEAFGLSARRLWEHTESGQINVFRQAISSRPELNDAAAFIDVIQFEDEAFSLLGFTLADMRAGRLPKRGIQRDLSNLPRLVDSANAASFVRMVARHLDLCAIRQAMRSHHQPFLPVGQPGDVFGIPHIFSTLHRLLRSMGRARARADQWLHTIQNFQKKGLRGEELEFSCLMPELAGLDDFGDQASASELAKWCNFEELRMSVIPVVSDAQRQLRFISAPNRKLNRTRNLPKAIAGLPRAISGFDPVLGYRVERVEYRSLWGTEHHWQAVTHQGAVIRNNVGHSGFSTAQAAAELAASHAKQHFPKRLSLGRWSHIAWTGGKDYREWLITLPFYPASYFSSHFKIRNVLAHVRCDLREGADGERVLLLQEVQSDWAQDARRAIACGDMSAGDAECPPFLKEWPALAMKLVLLHAAHEGLDAVTWTRGAHQVFRYKGLGATGLNELYDRTLPREVNRMMKPFGGACEMLGVFVPTNFRIKQTENGYEVFTAENELLGTAPTLEDAREFVPDKGHELLYEVHGVRLPAATRKAIQDAGFPAWG